MARRPKPAPRAGIYARVSTADQQTIPAQVEALRRYCRDRGWQVVAEAREVGSGIKTRPKRDELLGLARQRQLDVLLVWKLDRWGRSLPDLVHTFQELGELGVGFVSYSEALDFTTPAGRALAGMLAVFAQFERDILRERITLGMARAQEHGTRSGKAIGRPSIPPIVADKVRGLAAEGLSPRKIAGQLGDVSRSSVRRILGR